MKPRLLLALAALGLALAAYAARSAHSAAPAAAPQAQEPSFSGQDGGLLVRDGTRAWIFIVRDKKVYRIEPSAEPGKFHAPWATLAN
jgi:hypothetical protein